MHDMAPAAQDKPTDEYYRALLAERGIPIFQGGSPELEEQGGGSSESEAPETDKPTGEESFTDFDPSQIPDDATPEWLTEKYAELRKGFTQKTQEFGETRRELEQARQLTAALRNPQVAPAVLAQLGYDERKILEMFGYQPEEEAPEAEPDLYDRLERVEGTLSQREAAEQQARQEEAVSDFIAGQIEALEQKEGREFDQEEHRLLDAYARQFAKETPTGRVPDVEGAYGLLSGLYSARQKQWIESKKTPRPPGDGKAGSRTVDLSKESREDRLDRMAHAVGEAQSSQT